MIIIYNNGVPVYNTQEILWYNSDGGNHWFFSRLKGFDLTKKKNGVTGVRAMYQPLLNIMLFHNGILGIEFLSKYLVVFGRRRPWFVFQKSEEEVWRITS